VSESCSMCGRPVQVLEFCPRCLKTEWRRQHRRQRRISAVWQYGLLVIGLAIAASLLQWLASVLIKWAVQ